jgi:haloacetate dehalogenase
MRASRSVKRTGGSPSETPGLRSDGAEAAKSGSMTPMPDALFSTFESLRIDTGAATINLVRGGAGPPLLLLHGYPQTRAMWHRVAPALARDFTVVVPDLRGYGDSSKPEGGPDHAGYSKRAMAGDQVEVMQKLGFDRFGLAGHDRGARVAYRLALDHPDRVTRLAVLDIVPTYAAFTAVDKEMATGSFHWFFLIQPYDLPERLIGAEPDYFLNTMLGRWGGRGLDPFSPAVLAEYARCFRDPATIHATCEDYRAGATIDFEIDRNDYGRRRITCPTLVLYGGAKGRRPSRGRDMLEVWREWATDVRVQAFECGHFIPEEAPDETIRALGEFFAGAGPTGP